MSNKKSLKESLDEALAELDGARDEVRLSAHLLSLEAKESWREIEESARDVEDKVRAVGEQVAEDSAARVVDAARAVRAFVERHVRRRDEARL